MRRRCCFVLIGAVLLSFGFATEATAKVVEARFDANASDGYFLAFRASESGRRSEATIAVGRETGSASYQVTADAVNRGWVSADFGRFGEIRVEFDPRGSPTGGRCATRREGTFRGLIRFEGDDGFTELNTRSVRGSVVKRRAGVCVPGISRAQRDPNFAVLEVCDKAAGYAYFAARDPEILGRQVLHAAAVVEQVGRVQVARSTSVFGGPRTFRFTHRPKRATVLPPAPFTGSGSFADRLFEGSIVAPFPGVEGGLPIAPARGQLIGDGDQFSSRCDELFNPDFARLSSTPEATPRPPGRSGGPRRSR